MDSTGSRAAGRSGRITAGSEFHRAPPARGGYETSLTQADPVAPLTGDARPIPAWRAAREAAGVVWTEPQRATSSGGEGRRRIRGRRAPRAQRAQRAQ